MQTPIGGREVATLYNELRDCLRAKNHEQAKRVYRELVRAGHPLSEILGEATNILDTVKQFEPLDASLRQSPLRQLNTVDLTSESPARLVGSVFLPEGPDISSISPPEPDDLTSSYQRGILPKHTESTRYPGAQTSIDWA